ncbi:MAG TPA: response regulator transcription factor [Drouetiella sp.]
MAKILLVEDDASTSAPVADWLSREGHNVEVVADGLDALQLMSSFEFEIVILDWNLPGIDGPEILRRFRASGGQTQVIFLTGQTDWESRTTGLDAGADDYVVKPVDLRELSARVRSRLRRPGQFQPLIVTIGGLHIDSNSKKVVVHNKAVHFTSKEYAVLEFLVRHRGTTFSAKALRDQIWPTDSEVSEGTIRMCIQSVRKKLGADCEHLLQTIPKGGYFIVQD